MVAKNRGEERIASIHPGDVPLEDFLRPIALAENRLVVDISLPSRRISEIVHGKRTISADTALRLGPYFGTSEQFCLNVQVRYDLDLAAA